MADYDFVTALLFCHDLETLNKIILQAVTTTHLIKYDTVERNMLHISKYDEMNITFFSSIFLLLQNHHPKPKQQNINEENNVNYKSVDARSA